MNIFYSTALLWSKNRTNENSEIFFVHLLLVSFNELITLSESWRRATSLQVLISPRLHNCFWTKHRNKPEKPCRKTDWQPIPVPRSGLRPINQSTFTFLTLVLFTSSDYRWQNITLLRATFNNDKTSDKNARRLHQVHLQNRQTPLQGKIYEVKKQTNHSFEPSQSRLVVSAGHNLYHVPNKSSMPPL